MPEKLTVAVDLDATLIDYRGWKGSDHFGALRPGAAEFVRRLRKKFRVMILTTRCKANAPDRTAGEGFEEQLKAGFQLAENVRRWLLAHGVEVDEVYYGQGKPMYVAVVDDRAVPVPANPEPQDFEAAYQHVCGLAGVTDG